MARICEWCGYGLQPGQPIHADCARKRVDQLEKSLTDLRLMARVLLQNAEGCAVNHYGAMAAQVDRETGNCRECQGGLTCMHCHPEDRPTQTLRIAALEAALADLVQIVTQGGSTRGEENAAVETARNLLSRAPSQHGIGGSGGGCRD